MVDVKQAVAREKARHEADQKRMAKEIQDLEELRMAAYDQVAAVALESRGCAEMRAPTGDRGSHELIPLEVERSGMGQSLQRICSGSLAKFTDVVACAHLPSHATSEAWQLASHDTSGLPGRSASVRALSADS